MRKTQVTINKKVYLGFSIPYLTKIQMYGFSYNYIKEKGNNKPKSCYVDMAGFTIHIKTKDLCKDFWKLVEDRFHTSHYNIKRPLPMGKNKKSVGSMKEKFGGEIMKELARVRPKNVLVKH